MRLSNNMYEASFFYTFRVITKEKRVYASLYQLVVVVVVEMCMHVDFVDYIMK